MAVSTCAFIIQGKIQWLMVGNAASTAGTLVFELLQAINTTTYGNIYYIRPYMVVTNMNQSFTLVFELLQAINVTIYGTIYDVNNI